MSATPPPPRTGRLDEPTLVHDMRAELAAMSTWGRADLPATLGGRYELREIIGRGGMADVFRAYDALLDRDVAVKVLRDDGEGDRRRFMREAKTLATLSHPGIVSLLDAGLHEATPYLVMDLVPGTTLSAHLGAPLSPARAAEVGAAAAVALAHAHAQGVVHRDVKPGNLLVRDDGRIMLADFGIARMAGEMTNHTNTGAVIGSVHYLAPEQVASQEITPAADIYALGMLLLRALTGRHAFEGTNVESAVARLTSDPDVPDSLGPAWQGLLREMTARLPSDRPTAEQAAERLAALAEERPAAPAVPVAATSRVPSWASLPVAAGAVALLALLAAVMLGPGGSGGSPAVAETAAAPDASTAAGQPTAQASAKRRPAAPAPASTPTPTAGASTNKASTTPKASKRAAKDKPARDKGEPKGKSKGGSKRGR
jgi:hypothetical protein